MSEAPINRALFRAQARRESIPDPTIRTSLPTSLLSALGNAHVNLSLQVHHLAGVLDTIGWPEGSNQGQLDLDGPNLSNAIDYARENARLTWVLCGLVDSLKESLGQIIVDDDGTTICVGNECEHDTPGMTYTVNVPDEAVINNFIKSEKRCCGFNCTCK